MESLTEYPKVRRDDDHVDVYHEAKVKDPYVWLEDPDSEETKKFVEDQNAVTMPFLQSCKVKDKFYERLISFIRL